MPPAYLRHPHLHGDALVFVAEDDVWTAPVAGGRAWRLTADAAPVARPRLSPDGARVAWTSWRDGAPEVFVADLDGGPARRLTWWGEYTTRLLGWADDDAVRAVSATGQPAARHRWCYTVPVAGGPPQRLPLGPLGDLATADGGPSVLLSATLMREMAWQKRYRGGTAGKLWWDRDGSGAFERLAADLDGNLDSPMLVGDRIAFLSDHEGWGNLYSLALDGTGLRRHTDHGGDGAPPFYVRHAATDGTRVVYESAGELWFLADLDTAPERIDVRSAARAPTASRTASRRLSGWAPRGRTARDAPASSRSAAPCTA